MYNIIGKKVQRNDAYEKVSGKAIYGDDIQKKRMLYAACRYSDIPAGKITGIDVSIAAKIQGVEKILLYSDIPGETRLGPIRRDHYAIVNKEVFYSGDVIAVLVGQSKEAAQKAADSIIVEYEAYTGVFCPVEALNKDARLVHPEYKTNEVVHYPLRKGNVKEGFKNSEHVIERNFKTGFHEHAYIEPETVTAEPDFLTGGLKIYGSIQNPFTTRKVVALFLGLKMNQINVISSTVGGSFGGKDDVINYMACRVALAAKVTGMPVKLTNTRENSLKESYKRHPYVMNYKVGFNKNGKLNAMKINIIADSGAYSSQSFFVTWRSVVQATGPYQVEHVETDIRAAYTNNTYTAAFRGFGSPQIIFAQESLMDEIAHICEISPLEIRKINGFKQNDITASGQQLCNHKVSLEEVISKAIEKADYHNKIAEYKELNKTESRYKKGIGLSCSYRGCSLGAEGTDMSSAIVSVQADGSVYVLTGVHENGQGLQTTFCIMVAEIFGVPLESVIFIAPQTSSISDGGPTVASRGTLVGGNATVDAANIVKNRLFEQIKADLEVDNIEETIWENGHIKAKNNNKKITFSAAAERAYWAGINLSAYGWFKGPDVGWNEETGQGNAYFTYVYGCQIADISVDTYTGKIKIEKITAAHDVGKVINKTGAEGQVYGGVTQGVGYAVLEDYNISNGLLKSNNFDEYLIPTIKDIGSIEAILVENHDPTGPFGAKGMGEPTLELASAAINNAVFFATGKLSNQIPLTLEQVFLNKNLRKPERQSEIAFKDSCKISDKKENLLTDQPPKQAYRSTEVEILVPENLEDALKIINEKQVKIISGGTDVMIELRMKTAKTLLLDISNLKELKGISVTDNEIRIGSAENFTAIIQNEAIKKHFPMLVLACSTIGSKQIRNRGTIGGNIANAAPCADSVPPLIVANAKIVVQSVGEQRIIPVSDFVVKNYTTQLNFNEIIREIILPMPTKSYNIAYEQLGRRAAVNITRLSVGVAISLNSDKTIDDCIIVSGSLFNKPTRITEIENILIGKLATNSITEQIVEPLKNIVNQAIGNRWSSEYKIPVFINMCKDAVKKAINN